MIDDVPTGTVSRAPDLQARRHDALAQQLHAVIRHGDPPRPYGVVARWVDSLATQLEGAIRDGDRRKPAAATRAISILDELTRAARITTRVWSDAIASSLAVGRTREPRRGRTS